VGVLREPLAVSTSLKKVLYLESGSVNSEPGGVNLDPQDAPSTPPPPARPKKSWSEKQHTPPKALRSCEERPSVESHEGTLTDAKKVKVASTRGLCSERGRFKPVAAPQGYMVKDEWTALSAVSRVHHADFLAKRVAESDDEVNDHFAAKGKVDDVGGISLMRSGQRP